MDGQNLQNTYPLLISRMEKDGYSETYINRFKREIERLLADLKTNRHESYRDYYLSEAKNAKSASCLCARRGIIGAIERFDLYGAFPDRSQKTIILRDRGYDLLSEEFKGLIDVYRKKAKERGKKDETVYKESHQATTFLLSLQDKRITSLNQITENAVPAAFLEDGKSRGYSYRNSVAAVLRTCIPFYPDNRCERILSFLPAFRVERKNIQYLSKEEVERIKHVLEDEHSCLSLRDRAIGLLALYMGLRGCDIAALRLDAIDWSKDLISIRQQKTEVPLELPLMPVAGNAIYDYLKKEKPQVACDEVFISKTAPFAKLRSASMYSISKKIMDAAAVRMNPGDRKGFHLFRHRMVVSLLENGVPQPVISRIMGHVSPASLDAYLSADFSHLKACALSIASFPLAKEVLS
jgi:integrase